MNSFKTLKKAFRSKKKESSSTSTSNANEPIKQTISSPSSSDNDNTKVAVTNGTTHSIGHHSNASSISRAGLSPSDAADTPDVPPLPAVMSGSSSIVDLTGFAQPQPSTTIETTEVPRTPGTPGTPSNPQLHIDSPLIRTQNEHLEATGNDRPTESPLRAPQTIQTRASQVADDQDDSATNLQRSATLPPSYNSLNIPLSGNMHAASAPSPDTVYTPSPVVSTVVAESPVTTTASPVPYVVPPPASYPSPPGQHSLQQQPYPQPYAVPTPSGSWAAQQAYATPSTVPQHSYATPSPVSQRSYATPSPVSQQSYATHSSGSQHYGHRPFVAPGSENQTYPIIMAIDWGTTYSSMAYAFQQDGEVHEVSTWPKQTHSYPKVPTCNLYGPNSKEILEWGYTAKVAITKPPYKNHVLLSKYKLHLDEASGPHPPLPNGLGVVDAIADYLRVFHAHVLQTVLLGFGAAFEQRHIQYCLSVPAMWNDNAKAMMRQAALQAGMITPLDPPHRLLLISEPEAAALYCEKKCDQFQIGHGQRFMICDAGGGTVDLIVFEVAVGPHGRTLKEVTRGSGHSCGSIFLDERMEALLRRRFSKWQEKGLTAANWVQLMDTFIHNVKPLFDGVEDQYIPMPPVPGRADLTDYDIGLEDGTLTVTAEEMRREVFDPVVNDVLRLIQHQLQQTNYQCHAIFLVGGFGSSSYLHSRVKSEFGKQVPMIGVPPRAELAVVRGAAYAGLMPRTITQRVARRWYGVDSLMAYEEGMDSPLKMTRGSDGTIRAKDRFSVYVSPGQQIGVDECISKRYITYQYPNPINSPLFACSSMNMPRYVDSPYVERIGEFTIPLPFIPGAKPGHRVIFELRMYFGATEIRAEAEVNGMVVSTRCQFTG
ncbi:Heat shock 70 kDa protein 12A [Mortierella sp. AD094]|nr:Heat shock 70 kDa protein 12A [Mortierella sp. AD094]